MKPNPDREPISVLIAGFLLALFGVGFLLFGLSMSIGGWFSGPHVLFPGLMLLVLSYGMIEGVSRLNKRASGNVRFAVIWALITVAVFGIVSILALLDRRESGLVGSIVYGSIAGLAVLIVACLRTRSATVWLQSGNVTRGESEEVLNADLAN